jgi:hypothetical protein
MAIPPPEEELSDTVLPVIVNAPESIKIPPPKMPGALLAVIRELTTFSVPPKAPITPPPGRTSPLLA